MYYDFGISVPALVLRLCTCNKLQLVIKNNGGLCSIHSIIIRREQTRCRMLHRSEPCRVGHPVRWCCGVSPRPNPLGEQGAGMTINTGEGEEQRSTLAERKKKKRGTGSIQVGFHCLHVEFARSETISTLHNRLLHTELLRGTLL